MAPGLTRSVEGGSGSDMQIDSEVEEEEEQIDVDGEEEELEDEDEDEQVEEEDDQGDEDDEPPPPVHPKLRIKLKLPTVASSSNSPGTTPDVELSPSKRRRAEIDVESEDPSQSESERSSRPMTARQAVLASVVDSTHVSLTGRTGNKKQLNESELALRREETARKRKNLSEKKLEDEKLETINRLLKKQSRPRGRRPANALPLEDTPSATPKVKAKSKLSKEQDVDEDVDMDVTEEKEEAEREGEEKEESKPVTMYRWVTSTQGDGEDKKTVISFSVPTTLLPPVESPVPDPLQPSGRGPGVCAIEGCSGARKYRLVKDWSIGACGLDHLRLLEGQ